MKKVFQILSKVSLGFSSLKPILVKIDIDKATNDKESKNLPALSRS